MADWYPLAIINHGNSAGAYTDNGEPKGLLHTTEGKNYLGAKSAYQANNSWPHFTVSYELGFFQVWQHNPISLASRSLRNLSGGVQTNTDRVIQIEMVGTADRRSASSWGKQYVENFPLGYKDGIKALMRWCEQQLLIPRRCTVTFLAYPESYGNTHVRLSGPAFDAYSGWLGHQNAAENDHGDPGLIDITYLLDDTGDWFDMATKQDLLDVLKQHDEQVAIVSNLVTATPGDVMPMAAAASYSHEAGYWGFVNGQLKPIISTTHENPTLWYAVGPGMIKRGPFTAVECEELVTAEVASFHRTTDPTWRPYAIKQWVMDACELVYEHLPIES